MYLAELSIQGFRKFSKISVNFNSGINIIVGPNNTGKTAIVDALRCLLSSSDSFIPITSDDLHLSKDGTTSDSVVLNFSFHGLTTQEESEFYPALRPLADTSVTGIKYEACFGIRYSPVTGSEDRLRARKWCGEHEDNPIPSNVLENLRCVYMQPLRDPRVGLCPGRSSRLARLLGLLSSDASNESLLNALQELDKNLANDDSIKNTKKTIDSSHSAMLGDHLKQALDIQLLPDNIQKIASRLSLLADNFDIEQNGLGFNNLIFMAIVLSELACNTDSAYRGLIIEEPEAHLHPQLQYVLLQHLESIGSQCGDSSTQIFVTSHSPNFISTAKIDNIISLNETSECVEVFLPKIVKFEKTKKEKLERYLTATRAELFSAGKVIFVEGISEQLLVPIMAQQMGFNLRQKAVSVINVDGLNFDSFLPLFGNNAIKIPVAVIVDSDSEIEEAPSSATKKIKDFEDDYIKICVANDITFEHELLRLQENQQLFIDALKSIHPTIGANLESEASNLNSVQAKAAHIFKGMFKREGNLRNVHKGQFAQALAHHIKENSHKIKVPDYIKDAIKHVCQMPTKGIQNDINR